MDSTEDTPRLDISKQRLKFLGTLFLIGVFAFLLRYLHVLATVNVPTSQMPVGDALAYLLWAREISDGNWYGSESFYQAPLYPYFLASIIWVFGESTFVIQVVQSLLGALSVVFIGAASSRFFGNAVGIMSAIGLAIYPFSIYYDGIVQKTSLGCFLICVCLLFTAYLHQRKSLTRSFGLGFAMGLLALTRENALLWLPLFVAYIFLRTSMVSPESPITSDSGIENDQATSKQPTHSSLISKKYRLAEIAMFLTGCGVLLVAVAARNASLGGRWAPTTVQVGPNFYIGNHRDATGLYLPLVPGHETPEFERADAKRLAENATGKKLDDAGVSKYWMGKSFDDIRADPVYWIQLVTEKVLITVNAFEVPDVESPYVYSLESPTLRLLMRLWHFGWLAPLAVLGLVLGRQIYERRDFPWILIALAISMLVAVAAFFILGRYRFPLVPLLMPLAALGLAESCRRLYQRESLGRLGPALFLITCLVCRLPVVDTLGLNSSSLMNAGVAAAQTGNTRQAISLLRSACQKKPELAEPHFNLGKAFLVDGNNRDALEQLLIAKELSPSLAFLDRHLGEAYAKTGRLNEALESYQNAVIVDPQDDSAQSMIEQIEVVLDQQRHMK